MKTILALCLISAAFAIPAASASNCDPVTGSVCEGSYGYGDCATTGYAYNYASYYSYDSGAWTAVGASTYCYSNPSWGIEQTQIGAYAESCDASWNCDSAGVYWYGYDYSGYTYCDTYVQSNVDGQYQYQSVGCPAGAPPAVPAVLP